ncbi:MAG: transcriptional repressor LexA [Candidatus Binatia bacterium]
MEGSQSSALVDAAGEFECCDTVEIPLLGVVAAGEPYAACVLEETLNVPTTLWGGKRVFALRVRGHSMIDEGIHNGDYLIVEPRPTAENGQTVVAEIDGCVTVKKYYREADGQVRLQPANPEMLPLIINGGNARVIGVVAGILRKFGFDKPGALLGATGNRPAPSAKTPVTSRRSPVPDGDSASLELAVNVMDSQLVRWQAAIARAEHDKRLRRQVPQMEEMSRNLQAVRDWCARTRKPSLRHALVNEANRIMRRMQRFATVTPVQLADLVLH